MAIKCPKCKADLSEDSHFCSKCGTPIKPEDAVAVSQTKTIKTPAISRDKTIAGKYKIVEEIGRGGMGVVYKAEDTKLKRNVALKFLPAELTQDEEAKKRFVQEAQAAAALNHPNICTIYEIDETKEQTFISMEYIEGSTLKEKLASGPLGIDEVKDIAIQVALGLDKAHNKGILHRDIKPANIMINEEGQVKIMDFGLAKLSWGVDLTKTSTIMGTVAYMSPEQARADEVDHRTDIWSLGAMMYEMLTGERPFAKEHEQALIFSILNDEPKAISSFRSDVPNSVESTIYKALEKNPSKRHQNVQEFINALKEKPQIPTSKSEKSIAVLPFTNMSADPEQEYFCDGIAEEIINSLTKIKDLHVVARTSAFYFKGKNVKVSEIGRELKVEYVLEGSVRKAGNRLRVTAQLISVSDGYHLWSDRYDCEIKDIFAIQDEISLAIVDTLKVKLFKEEKADLVKHPTSEIEVFNLYLRGRYHWQRFTVEDLNKSQEYFERAIELDPNFSPAYADLAGGVYMQLAGGGQDILPPRESMSKAKAFLDKALEIEPNNGDTLSYMGLVHTWYEHDWESAQEIFLRANEVDPNKVFSHGGYAFFLSQMGRHEEAIKEQKRAIELDPLAPLMYNNAAHFCYNARQYDQAFEYCQHAIDLNPLLPIAQWVLGLIHIQKGNPEKAIELIEPLVANLTYTYGFLGHAYAKANKRKKAHEVIDILKAMAAEYHVESYLAMIHCGLGENDKAFENLERSFRVSPIDWSRRGIAVTHGTIGVDPIWDPIRKDDRFVEILNKIGLSHLTPKKASPKLEKSIVVLPFDDVSPDKDNEYFSDGLTEEIISDLSKVSTLRVISKSSAMTFKGTKKKIREIAKDVDVSHVLEGSVRKAGNNLRITAQLIDAANDAHLWSEKFSGTMDDVFDIQEKVSRSIVDALKLKLSPEEEGKIAERPIDNVQAYECYMRARQEIYRLSEDSLARAIQLLQNGLDIIGENADLYAGMANAYYWNYEMFYSQDEETLQKAKGYAEKVIALNPDSSMGYYLLGQYERVAGDSKDACKYMNKAVSLDPHNTDILLQSTWINALYVGKPDEARSMSKQLLEIDPLTAFNYYAASLVPWVEGDFPLMEELAKKWYKMEPDAPLAALWYAWPLVWNKKNEEALAFIDRTVENRSHPVEKEYMLFLKYALLGQKSKALDSLSEQTKKFVWNDPGEGVWLTADLFAFLDEKEEALKWVERLLERGWINYPLLNDIDPFLEIIRGEERFKKLMAKVKKEWESFEV